MFTWAEEIIRVHEYMLQTEEGIIRSRGGIKLAVAGLARVHSSDSAHQGETLS